MSSTNLILHLIWTVSFSLSYIYWLIFSAYNNWMLQIACLHFKYNIDYKGGLAEPLNEYDCVYCVMWPCNYVQSNLSMFRVLGDPAGGACNWSGSFRGRARDAACLLLHSFLLLQHEVLVWWFHPWEAIIVTALPILYCKGLWLHHETPSCKAGIRFFEVIQPL